MKQISNIQEAEDYVFNYNFFNILNENKEFIKSNLDTCEQFAIQHKQYKLLCRTRTYILYLLIEENSLKAASKVAEDNLQLSREKKLDDELLYMISIIAHLYQLTGNYSASEELIQIALDKLETIKDDLKRCKTYLMIADQYFFTNHEEKCIEAYKKCLKHAHKTNDISLIAICYNNFAERLKNYNIPDQALSALNTGYEYALKSENKFIIAQLDENFGGYYTQQKNFQQAIYHIEKTLEYYRSSDNTKNVMRIHLDLCKIYINISEYEKAYELLKELEQKASSSDANMILLETYELFVEYYEKNNEYQLALDHLREYNKINALIHNEKSDEKIKNLQIQYEVKSIQSERDTASKLARIKHDFLANMSHEIRTPINSILGICYLLQQDKLSEKQTDYIRRLNQSGEQLLGIINDVLDISKIEAGKFHMDIRPFSIQKTVADIYDSLSIKATDKNLDISLAIDEEIPPLCIGDATRLGQIITNLLHNSIKFTNKGSIELTVLLSHMTENIAFISFDVKDTGIGMNAEKLQRIFNEYEQAETNTQIKFGGTGLGLSISKKLVELMNGKIEVNSAENFGSTFTFQIPFAVADVSATHLKTEIASCDSLSNKLIYIADDVEENRAVMAELLFSLNPAIQVGFADNGRELLDLMTKKVPDIVMMDLDMPELNGFEATLAIQKKYSEKTIKIIACTASLLTLPKEELLQYGFANLLLKPFTIKQLAESLN